MINENYKLINFLDGKNICKEDLRKFENGFFKGK